MAAEEGKMNLSGTPEKQKRVGEAVNEIGHIYTAYYCYAIRLT